MTYEEALARLIQIKEQLDYLPVIRKIEFDQGGDYQIGEMTWDHDNATLTVTYTHPDGKPGKRHKYQIDFDYYNIAPGYTGKTGFAGFMEDILNINE